MTEIRLSNVQGVYFTAEGKKTQLLGDVCLTSNGNMGIESHFSGISLHPHKGGARLPAFKISTKLVVSPSFVDYNKMVKERWAKHFMKQLDDSIFNELLNRMGEHTDGEDQVVGVSTRKR